MMEQYTVKFIDREISVSSSEDVDWYGAGKVDVTSYWSEAPAARHRWFSFQMLWSKSALYVRFDAAVGEPLIVSESPELSRKAIGLWDRDVCEIFVAPDRNKPTHYFEFEAAPTGEWLDVEIRFFQEIREANWEYHSGMQTASRMGENIVVTVIKIPFSAFARVPKAGDVWLGNVFRCVGTGEGRGYLAWRPTLTPKPSFHLPAAFGELVFE